MKISLSSKKFSIQKTFTKVSVCYNSNIKLRASRNILANSLNLLSSSSKLCKAQHVRKSEDLLTLAYRRRIIT